MYNYPRYLGNLIDKLTEAHARRRTLLKNIYHLSQQIINQHHCIKEFLV